jgi:plasmid stabilization system protein ParE
MKLQILDEAKEEAGKAFDWYHQRSPQAAERFADLLADAFASIVATPTTYPLYELRRNPGNIRRIRLRGYPYAVVYQLLEDSLVVIAVAHTSRRSGYWRSRLK